MGRKLIHLLATHPWVHIFLSVLALYAGVSEIWEAFRDEERSAWSLGAHHGVALLGLVNFLQALGNLLGSADQVDKALDRQ